MSSIVASYPPQSNFPRNWYTSCRPQGVRPKMPFPSRLFSVRVRNLIDELQAADHNLKAETVEGALLSELRQALDNIRLTAWTVSELQNARDNSKDTRAMVSFLTAERLRRFRRMIDDFCSDLERDGAAWPASSMYDLQESVAMLRERLGVLTFRRRTNGS